MQIILRLSFTVSIVITNDTQRVNFTSWSDSQTTKQLLNTLIVLRGAGIDRNSLIEMTTRVGRLMKSLITSIKWRQQHVIKNELLSN